MKKFLLILIFLNSCSLPGINERLETLNKFNQNQFKEEVYVTPYFEIYALSKIENLENVIIYIEGDGVSWVDRHTISSNPTPIDPLAFKLAKIDGNANVVYLARPCQYITEGTNCNNKDIWTVSQYSEAVLSSYKGIIDNFSQFTEIHIVGYSGGAGIAMYLASINNPKIKSIRTVAGNINHNRLAQLINISPLDKSINFYQIEEKTKNTPQTHYIGTSDKIIPRELSLGFKNKNQSNKCIKVQEVDASHNEGWLNFWTNEYQKIPGCS
jgi:hypothetical protein